jgi:kynurenine 3-monooxygenase
MPASKTAKGGFAIDSNHLHIWPRHAFMLIGLPNRDGSFTLTLFLPFADLERLGDKSSAAEFFTRHFPTAVDIVGVDMLVDDFMSNPRGNLVTINVSSTPRTLTFSGSFSG